MSTYKAGLLNVGTLNATGSSALLEANTANVTTLTATTVNAQTLNVPSSASRFVVPREQRSMVTMSAKDYPGTNYQAATDGSGNSLPFFTVTTQGNNNSVELNLPEFGAFNVTGIPGVKAQQQSYQGVCDLDYVYFIWEIGQDLPTSWTGTYLGVWQAFAGNFQDWMASSVLIVKLDRNTGEIVQMQQLGLMMDQAYLAAGSTKAAQELAVGPGVYTADINGDPVKDASGNYVTSAVNGTDKNAPGYIGFQSRNTGQTWAQAGDDNSRGPLQLYQDPDTGVNYLYLPGNAQKYASISKIRCSDLTLVWRRTIDPMYYAYENASLTNAGRVMRQLMVVPPRPGRDYPVVVATATDNFSYSTINLIDVGKLWDYYKSGGSVQAWADYGLTAEPMWQTLIGPTPLDVGDALPVGLFRQVNPSSYNPMTIDGVTETIDASGYIKDEDGNVSIELYAPLKSGYLFTDGSANDPTVNGCKTTGEFNLLTGASYVCFLDGIEAVIASSRVDSSGVLLDPGNFPVQKSIWEFAKFSFTSDSSNVTQLTGGLFDVSKNYTGIRQNGPNAGSSITVSGYTLLQGVPDSSGRYFPQQNDGSGNFQPVLKKVYLAQALAGRAIADIYEGSEVDTFGGGCYMSIAYDYDTDVFVTTTGQIVGAGAGIEKDWSLALHTDVSCNGVFYPGVTTPYQVPDLSGGFIYNTYIDDSGNLQNPNTFNGAGTPFFKGLNQLGQFIPYKPYAFDFMKKNPLTGYRTQFTNYFMQTANFLGANADASGLLLTNMSTNPQLWIPGGDASGNITEFNQAIFIQQRAKAWWDKIIMMRDNLNLGARYNRQGTCGFTGIKVSNGELMFSINTHGYDVADHSNDFSLTEATHTPSGVFKISGTNADACSVSILNMVDSSGINRKLLTGTTKTRFFMLDYKLLVDSSGNSKTLTHVPGDSSLDYKRGCQTNTWKNALLYESDFGNSPQAAVFNGHGTDGVNFIHDVNGLSKFPPVANVISGMVPGKEVHGLDMDPYVAQNAWQKPLGSRDPNLLALIGRIGPLITFGFPPAGIGAVDGSYNFPLPAAGSPSGGATDQQLGYLLRTYADIATLVATYPTQLAAIGQLAALQALLSPTSSTGILALLGFLGFTQYAGALNLTTRLFSNGSYRALANSNINCYDLQTILNNSITDPSGNTPNNVIKYQFLNSDIYNTGWANQGPQIYGNVVFKGNTNGIVEVFDINTGFPINKPIPRDASGNIDPQGVSNIRTPNTGIYNPEGQRVIPLIADGLMYGYGGANKFQFTNALQANKIFMWTPYGK
jgi:hypothetical protein